jgi:hypothetical protein
MIKVLVIIYFTGLICGLYNLYKEGMLNKSIKISLLVSTLWPISLAILPLLIYVYKRNKDLTNKT